MIEKYRYKTTDYLLRPFFREMIGFDAIEMLHLLRGFESLGDTPGNDNNSRWHNLFYSKMRGSWFMESYRLFILNEIAPRFNEPIVYQKYPTLRIQIPGRKGVADYHVDSEYNHPIDEVNIWLPFTHSVGSRSIYIESRPGLKDYQPQEVRYGQYLMFPGGRLSHGNEINTTNETRVSIDMRVIPASQFKPSELKGLSHGKVRDIGGEDSYYDVI